MRKDLFFTFIVLFFPLSLMAQYPGATAPFRRRCNPGFIFRRLFLRQKCRQRIQRMGRTGHIQFHSQSRHHRRHK